DRQRRERRRHAAIVVEGDVEPGHAADEAAEAPAEAERQTLARAAGAAEQPGEQRQAEEGEREQPEGGEGQDACPAREERDHPGRHAQAASASGGGRRSTRTTYTRRRSARSTCSRRPSTSMLSPRRGSRPK